jgi:glucose dehydrogenase
MARVIEADICIIGSGITAAMVAERVADERKADIVAVEAGDDVVPLAQRAQHRQRFLEYGEDPWPHDHVDGMTADGIQSRSMQVGGLAMHWGGVTPRFSPEDFRQHSLYGVGNDWPITYDDLEPDYLEAEKRLGVAGEQGPPDLDPRSGPFPMPPLPLTYNLQLLKDWVTRAGIPMWSQPSAKNSAPYDGRAVCCRNDTCSPMCPIGAKYSPDFTWNKLRSTNRVRVVTRTLVRRLELDAASSRIARAIAVDRDHPDEPVELHAKTFVVAGGYVWSSWLLLVSASDRMPHGIANSSGLVGHYLAGHRNVSAFIELPLRLYPGINTQHSLVSKKYMRPGRLSRYVRHDLRVWESTFQREPRLRDDHNRVLLGDEIMKDWRDRTSTGVTRVRAYYDVIPGRDSTLTLDPSRRNPWGDPLPRLDFQDAPESKALRAYTEQNIRDLFDEMARAGNGKVLASRSDDFQDHPSGGCRMGDDPADSVCDSYGRTHDHENLFVVGAPTTCSGGCANATLTFSALALRAASKIGEAFVKRA